MGYIRVVYSAYYITVIKRSMALGCWKCQTTVDIKTTLAIVILKIKYMGAIMAGGRGQMGAQAMFRRLFT